MRLQDWNVELRYLLPEVSRLVIRCQFMLSKLLLVLANYAWFDGFPNEARWRASVEHDTDHSGQDLLCVLPPGLLTTILWIGSLYRSITALLDGDDKAFRIRCTKGLFYRSA